MDIEHPVFKTQASTKIYFQNIRSFRYQRSDITAQSIWLYQWKNDLKKDTIQRFQFGIADHWKHDEAYFIMECEGLNSMKDTIWFTMDTSSHRSEWVAYIPQYRKSHYQWAYTFFQSNDPNQLWWVRYPGQFQFLPFLPDRMERNKLRFIIRDYFELVGVIK